MPDPIFFEVNIPSGDPLGPRIIKKLEWARIQVACFRPTPPDWRAVEDGSDFHIGGPGVYVSWNRYTESSYPEVYIGSARRSVRERMARHIADRSDPMRAHSDTVIFTDKLGELTGDHAEYVEGRMIQLARSSLCCHLINKTNPTEPQMAAKDQALCERFLAHVLKFFPLLGVSFFFLPGEPGNPLPKLYLEKAGLKAYGWDGSSEFLIAKGSDASIDVKPTLREKNRELDNQRKRLIRAKDLFDVGGKFRFERNISIEGKKLNTDSRRSYAMSLILGRHATTGHKEWRKCGDDGEEQ